MAAGDSWKRLEVYRERYEIEHMLEEIPDLTRSLQRRQMRRHALTRRRLDLEAQLAEVRSELDAVERELDGSRATWELMIEEVLDKVRRIHGEGWSPTPVRGFRVWSVANGEIRGNQVPWPSPTQEAVCLRGMRNEDVPHSTRECGPPACGIYAVKDLDMFPPDVARSSINNSVVGVVALTGKVVEHTSGYRAARATAVAVSALSDGTRLVTDDSHEIEALFQNPAAALGRWGDHVDREVDTVRGFLELAMKEETTWT